MKHLDKRRNYASHKAISPFVTMISDVLCRKRVIMLLSHEGINCGSDTEK